MHMLTDPLCEGTQREIHGKIHTFGGLTLAVGIISLNSSWRASGCPIPQVNL